MKNLSTPRAILFGMGLIALSIVSLPYSSKYISNAKASNGFSPFSKVPLSKRDVQFSPFSKVPLSKRDIQNVLNNCVPMIQGTVIHMNC